MAMFGKVNKKILEHLQTDFQPQKLNRYKFLILQNPFASVMSGISSAVGVGISAFYVRGGSFPVSNEYVYEPYGINKYLKDITFPDSFSVQFFEDEDGTVLRYFTEWKNEIESSGLASAYLAWPRDDKDIKLQLNQENAKRTGMLMLQSSGDKTSTYPRIMYYGMTLKKIDDITLSDDNSDALIYNVTFGVDEVSPTTTI